MKKWPKNNKVIDFEELTSPIREAILFAYNIERKNKNRSIPWKGYDIGEDVKVSCPSPNEILRYDMLQQVEENQDRDALQEIIGIAIQLGMEQGRRKVIDSIKCSLIKDYLFMTKSFLDKAINSVGYLIK